MSEKLRVLIVDDDRRMAKTLCDILKVKGFEATPAYSGQEALSRLAEASFDCVLTDVKMPEINGVKLLKAIRAKHLDLPVVLMTAYAADELAKNGLEEGAIASLTKPLDINLLLSFLSSLRKERSIVIVDDDPNFMKTLSDILRERSFEVSEVSDPSMVLENLVPNGQIVILDMKLNRTNGLAVLKEIREKYPHLPVVVVTGYRQEMAAAIEAALSIGAYTCLYKPFGIEELLKVLADIRKQELNRALGQPVRKRRQGDL